MHDMRCGPINRVQVIQLDFFQRDVHHICGYYESWSKKLHCCAYAYHRNKGLSPNSYGSLSSKGQFDRLLGLQGIKHDLQPAVTKIRQNIFHCILRQKQTIQQIGALFLLLAATVLQSVGEGSNKGSTGANVDQVLFNGIVLVKKHSSYLMTIEMSIVGSHVGGVRKGLVIVSTLLITALPHFIFEGKPSSSYCLVALPLVVSSISIYQK
ncbi:unnamed protein product [Vicia faba]|uniref:Uncharacterized protein n=1 Tax=Vicia faba TaxID=3906 RepID=A0AAV1ASS9_VICFA|nr:unnamed protein product [Vicia faba]